MLGNAWFLCTYIGTVQSIEKKKFDHLTNKQGFYNAMRTVLLAGGQDLIKSWRILSRAGLGAFYYYFGESTGRPVAPLKDPPKLQTVPALLISVPNVFSASLTGFYLVNNNTSIALALL